MKYLNVDSDELNSNASTLVISSKKPTVKILELGATFLPSLSRHPSNTRRYPCMVTATVTGMATGHGVTKRCRLSLLTNSALVYESKCGGRGGVAGSQPVSTAMHMEPK
jgi:hypothetical protein